MNTLIRVLKVGFAFVLVLGLYACGGWGAPRPVSLEVDQASVEGEFFIEEFDLEEVRLVLRMDDGSQRIIHLDETMVSGLDLEKLQEPGTHQIRVYYENLTADVTIRMVESLTVRLMAVYDLAVEAQAFVGTYEEWLETVRGPSGEDGRKVTLRVAEDHIQWQYEGDAAWNNLIALTALIGPQGAPGAPGEPGTPGEPGAPGDDGKDGREVVMRVTDTHIQWQYEGDAEWQNLFNLDLLTSPNGDFGLRVIDVEINELGEFVIIFNDDTTKNLGRILHVYTVSFKDYNGYVLDTQLVSPGEDALAPPDPVRKGYTFTGWSASLTNITGDTTIHAEYEIDTYTVTFETHGGSLAEALTGIEHGDTVTLPTPEKAGHVFLGWFSSESVHASRFTEEDPVKSDLVLHARWAVAQYLVRFLDSDGELSHAQHVIHGARLSPPAIELEEGFILEGWIEEDGDDFFNFFDKVESDLTLAPVIHSIAAAFMRDGLFKGLLAIAQDHYSDIDVFAADYQALQFTFISGDTKIALILYHIYLTIEIDDEDSGERLTKYVILVGQVTQEVFGDFDEFRVDQYYSYNFFDYLYASEEQFLTARSEFEDVFALMAENEHHAAVTHFHKEAGDVPAGDIAAVETYIQDFMAQEFIVTFETAGGTEVEPATVTFGATVELPEVTKEGHLLVGIYVDSEHTWLFDPDMRVTNDITLYYHWVPDVPVTIANVHGLTFGEGALIRGVITAKSHNTLFMEDDSGAIAIYHPALFDAAVLGDEVLIYGHYGDFHGLLQLTDVTFFDLLDHDQEPPPIVSIDHLDLEDHDVMRPYQSRRISLNGMEIMAVEELTSGTIEVTIQNVYGHQIIIRADDRLPAFAEIGPELLTLAEGDYLDIEGMILTWFHGAQILPAGPGQFTVTDTISLPPVIVGAADVTIVLGSDFDPYEDVTAIDIVDGDLTLDIMVVGEVDTDTVGTYELIYSVKNAAGLETSITRQVTVIAVDDPMDIADVHGLAFGEMALVQGIITAKGHSVVFMEDDTGAISIYDTDLLHAVNIGDEVLVYGEYGDFHGLLQLVEVSFYDILDHDRPLPPIIDIDHLDLQDNEVMTPYQSRRVSLTDMEVVGFNVDHHGNIQVTIQREDGPAIVIRADSRLPDFDEIGPALLALAVGDTIAIEGMTLDWRDVARLMLTAPGQFTVTDYIIMPPVIEGIEDITIERGSVFDPLEGVTATDVVDGDLTHDIVIIGEVDTTTAGVYEITYTVTNRGGRTTTIVRRVTVTAPVEPIYYPADYGWRLFYNDWEGTEATARVVDGEYVVTITKAHILDENWKLQVIQDAYALSTGEDNVGSMELEAGETYRVTFDARASVAGDITLAIGHREGEWTPYIIEDVSITTDMETYTVEFTLDDDDIDYSVPAQFKFEMGLLFADVDLPQHFVIDNVMVEIEVDGDFVDAELIVNGAFAANVEDYGTVYTSIVDVFDGEHGASLDDLLTIEGVVVSRYAGGYFISDGDHVLSIYGGMAPELGDELRITGIYSQYQTLYQVAQIINVDILSDGNEFALPSEEIGFSDFFALDLADPLIHGKSYQFIGRLVEKAPHGFMNYYLEDPDSDQEILFYWGYAPGTEAVFAEHLGEVVTLTAVYYANHATNGPMLNFDPVQDMIAVVEPETADKFAHDVDTVDDMTLFTVTGDIDLPVEGHYGTSFDNWTSSHPGIIDHDGTFVQSPAEDTLVTFTAVASLEEFTADVTIRVTVYASPTAIADVHALAFGDTVRIRGIITAKSHNTLFMEDDSGAIAVFAATLYGQASIGDEVYIYGEYGHFNGLLQLRDLLFYEILAHDQNLPPIIAIDDLDLEDNEVMTPYQSRRVSLIGMEVMAISEDEHDNIIVTLQRADGVEIIIRADSRLPGFDEIGPELLNLSVGDIIDIEGMTLDWRDGARLMPTAAGEFSLVED